MRIIIAVVASRRRRRRYLLKIVVFLSIKMIAKCIWMFLLNMVEHWNDRNVRSFGQAFIPPAFMMLEKESRLVKFYER